MGLSRFEYKINMLNNRIIEVFQQFGKVTIYNFAKSLVKMTSQFIEISGIMFGDHFIITFKNQENCDELQLKFNDALSNIV